MIVITIIIIAKIDLTSIDLVVTAMTTIIIQIPEIHASFVRNHTIIPGSIY
jgi:hypothetical protein